MTISSDTIKSGPYDGNDVTTSFDYNYKIFADADLQVVHTDSDEVETVLTLGVDYTVSGAGDDSGGSITYPVSGSPLPSGEKLTIVSDIDLKQLTDLSNQGGFFPEVHETVFDRLCRQVQQQAEKITRAVLAPISSSTLPADLYAALIAAAASAAASAASALATYTIFDDRYLGSYAANPTTLNDGITALDVTHDGIEYWDSTLKVRKTWNGSTLTWGLTSTSVATNAVDVNAADSGGYFTGTDLEDITQEIGVLIENMSDEIQPNWIQSAQVGNDLVISSVGVPALAALNGTDVAFIDATNDDLRTYRFDGTDWAQVGNDLNISGAGAVTLAALNGTDVAFIDATNADLRTYRFDGTDWAQVGNDLNISGVGHVKLAALNGTDVAFLDATNEDLRTYRFDGTDWAQVGNDLVVSGISVHALAALNGTDVAFIDSSENNLRTYRFDGTDWVQAGNDLTVASISSPALAALNGTDVAFIDATNDDLRTYRFAFYVGAGPNLLGS